MPVCVCVVFDPCIRPVCRYVVHCCYLTGVLTVLNAAHASFIKCLTFVYIFRTINVHHPSIRLFAHTLLLHGIAIARPTPTSVLWVEFIALVSLVM